MAHMQQLATCPGTTTTTTTSSGGSRSSNNVNASCADARTHTNPFTPIDATESPYHASIVCGGPARRWPVLIPTCVLNAAVHAQSTAQRKLTWACYAVPQAEAKALKKACSKCSTSSPCRSSCSAPALPTCAASIPRAAAVSCMQIPPGILLDTAGGPCTTCDGSSCVFEGGRKVVSAGMLPTWRVHPSHHDCCRMPHCSDKDWGIIIQGRPIMHLQLMILPDTCCCCCC